MEERKILFMMLMVVVVVGLFCGGVNAALTPIAHTDVVPYQRIEYGDSFSFGVVAFSKAGIDRVDFAISGQGYSGNNPKTTSVMALNTRVASTSPGAEYPGVYEYYVSIPSSEFLTNGVITVTPTVYGNDGGSRALSAVTLYVEGASDEPPVEVWVDAGASDGDGTVNDENDPYLSISSAISEIEIANGGNCDYATIYLAEGIYNTGITGSTTTSDEWLTITRESGADIANVIIDEDGTSFNTDHIKMSGVTLRSTGANDWALNQAGAWVDHCRLIGAGRSTSNSNPVTGASYLTGNYVYNVRFGIKSSPEIVRGLKVEYIGDDLAQNKEFLVNIQLDDIHGTYAGNHADVFQLWGATYDNIILYNIIATNVQYQGLFINGDGSNTNMAIVNCLIEIRTKEFGGSRFWIYDEWDHALLWHNTFSASYAPDSTWGWFYHNDYGGDGDDHLRDNNSYIGNVFRAFSIHNSPRGTTYMDSGNSYGNEALYNHFEVSSHNIGENETTGYGVIDFDTPGSPTFGYPIADSVIIDRIPYATIPGDALGNPRDSTPDIGAFEYIQTGPCQDSDGDTYDDIFCGGLDCDDSNNQINPGMIEIPYNSWDDDCNSLTLDDDLDQDSYLIATDCNDTNPSINPDATEICDNGIDENCNPADDICSTCSPADTSGDGVVDMIELIAYIGRWKNNDEVDMISLIEAIGIWKGGGC